jgi:hypothetical protein
VIQRLLRQFRALLSLPGNIEGTLRADYGGVCKQIERLHEDIESLRALANDYLNSGHWCEVVVMGEGSGGGLVWLAESVRLRDGDQQGVALEIEREMQVKAVIARGPCAVESVLLGINLVFQGSGQIIKLNFLAKPSDRVIVHLRGRLGP